MADSTIENPCQNVEDQQETIIIAHPIDNLRNRKSWPDLVGKDGETAKKTIEAEDPSLSVTVLPEGSIITMDLRTDRVRIWVDENGVVIRAPTVG